MIKFFRRIRQQLLTENKFSKYVLYAIGEIALVMIGILLALQVNNWNEERKSKSLVTTYIGSLQGDLKKDIELLTPGISYIEFDWKKNKSYSSRLSSPNATYDTLIKIARYEFFPAMGGPQNELNQNTYNTLLSTGDINLLDTGLLKKLQNHYTLASGHVNDMKMNGQIYTDHVKEYLSSYPTILEHNAINGSLMEPFWENIDQNDLKSKFNGILTARIFMGHDINSRKNELLSQTQEFVSYLDSLGH